MTIRSKKAAIKAFLLVAALAAVGYVTVTSSANAASPAAVSSAAAASSTHVLAGKAVTMTVHLQDPKTGANIAGVPVTLVGRFTSTAPFGTITTVTTSAAGMASTVIKPLHNSQYEWKFAGNSHYAASTSGLVTLTAAQNVAITAARPTSSTLDVWGTVTPNEAGRQIGLQHLVGGVWKTFAPNVTIKSQKMPNGVVEVGYVFHFINTGKGTFIVHSSIAATSSNAAGVSLQLSIILH